MSNQDATLLTFITDWKVLIAFLGLLISMGVALWSVMKEPMDKQTQARIIVPVILAFLGFIVGMIGIWFQHQDAKRDEARRAAAERTAQDIKLAAEAAAVNIADLAKLNEISPKARYHVRLSVDPRPNEPCDVARKIDRLFPGAIEAKGVRVIYRESFKKQPYILVFGRDLTLAAAEIYQRLAVAHQFANGLPPIEYEREEQEFDCSTVN